MGLIELIILIVIIGVVVVLVQRFAPIPAQLKTIILWLAVIVIVLIILNALGILGRDVAIPKIR